MSDILVVYYSRTGKTRLVAEKLAGLLGADLAEIRERKDRRGALGFISGGADTMLKRDVALEAAPDPGTHRVVLLGMPVWAFQPPAPVRAYLAQTDLTGKTVCAFCTSDGSSGKGVFKALGKTLPKPPAETFHRLKPRPDDAELDRALAEWAGKVKALAR